jgi:uncharacterized membrane protein
MGYWFRPKRYGYGASPSNWKGWLATAVFVALIAGLAWMLQPRHGGLDVRTVLIFYGALLLAVGVFAWIAWKKTEGPWRWRWGSGGKEK